MKKAVTVIGGATLALGAVGFASNAQADEVANQEITTQEAQQVAPVTQEQLASAKADVDTATEAVANVQAEVTKAQEAVTQNQAEVTNAQSEVATAEENVAKATPEAIQQAEAAITATTDEIANNAQAINKAKETEATAKEAVAAQETAVNQAQDLVSKAQTAVDSAQASVDQAQAILDGTNAQEIYDKAAATKKQVEADKQVVANAQAALADAQAADAKRADVIDTAEKVQATAQADLDTKVEALSQANTKATETASTLRTKQEAFTKAENDYKAINTITLPDEYVQALETLYNADFTSYEVDEDGNYVFHFVVSDEEREAAFDRLLALYQTISDANVFKSNPNEETTVYDTNNLPDAVITELSLFASDLINQIRAYFDTPETVVTSSSVKFADLVTDGYIADNHDTWSKGHDGKAINEAAAYFGLDISAPLGTETNIQFYENWAGSLIGKTATLSELKREVYDSIVLFMSGVAGGIAEWDHAGSIAGVRFRDEDAQVTYLGVDLTSPKDFYGGVHFIAVDDTDVDEATEDNFDTTPIENTKTAAAITASYNQAKVELDQATSANTQAQDAKAKAQQAVNDAQDTLDAAKAALASAKAVAIQAPGAQEKLDQANAKLAESIKANDDAQAAVDSLTADIKIKKANLEAAQAVLADKQEVLDSATAAYNTEVAKLTSLTAALAAATQTVADLEAKAQTLTAQLVSDKQALSDLKNAPELLKQAQAKLATAQTALKSSQEVLAEKESLLAELKATQADLQARYDSLAAIYDKQVEAERQAELAKQKATIEAQGKVAVAVVNEKGQVVGFMADEISSAKQAQTVAKPAVHQATAQIASTSLVAKTSKNQATLPSTGDKTSRNGVFIALGSFLIAIGLFGKCRKHH